MSTHSYEFKKKGTKLASRYGFKGKAELGLLGLLERLYLGACGFYLDVQVTRSYKVLMHPRVQAKPK